MIFFSDLEDYEFTFGKQYQINTLDKPDKFYIPDLKLCKDLNDEVKIPRLCSKSVKDNFGENDNTEFVESGKCMFKCFTAIFVNLSYTHTPYVDSKNNYQKRKSPFVLRPGTYWIITVSRRFTAKDDFHWRSK